MLTAVLLGCAAAGPFGPTGSGAHTRTDAKPLLRKEARQSALLAERASTWLGLDLETSPNSAADFHGDKFENLTWSYRATEGKVYGPEDWSKNAHCKECASAGTQSPIDYPPWGGNVEALPSLGDLNLYGGDCHILELEVNAHTTEVVYNDCGVEPHISWKGEDYRLVQFHFHSPSEHTVNGEYYPMEAHLVHKNMHGEALVLAVFVKAGEANGFLDKFWGKLNGLAKPRSLLSVPAAEKEADQEAANATKEAANATKEAKPATAGGSNFHAEEFGEQEVGGMHAYEEFVPRGDYYHYIGSFTTPPCTGDTIWLSYTTPVEASPEQIDAYRQVISGNAHNQLFTPKETPPGADRDGYNFSLALGVNNRPIQSLVGADDKHRKVYKYEFKESDKFDPEERKRSRSPGGKVAAAAAALLFFALW